MEAIMNTFFRAHTLITLCGRFILLILGEDLDYERRPVESGVWILAGGLVKQGILPRAFPRVQLLTPLHDVHIKFNQLD